MHHGAAPSSSVGYDEKTHLWITQQVTAAGTQRSEPIPTLVNSGRPDPSRAVLIHPGYRKVTVS